MMMAHDTRPYLHRWSDHSEPKPSTAADERQCVADPPLRRQVDEKPELAPAGAAHMSGSRASASLLRLLRPLLNACVLGGVTLTPVLSILGWVGLMMPVQTALHQAATALLCVAVIWLGFALATAHLLRGDRG